MVGTGHNGLRIVGSDVNIECPYEETDDGELE
jgi:hypothetical protein